MPFFPVVAALSLASSAAPLRDCDPARARVSPSMPTQGGIVRLEVDAAPRTPSATWRGKPVRFWRDSPSGPWRALLGIDLEQRPGLTRVALRGPGAPCAISLSV